MLLYILGAFVAGMPVAWAWGKYIKSVTGHSATVAAMWDILLILLASVVTLTLWARSGDSVYVLLAYAAGSGIGTFYVVQHNEKG